MNNIEEAAFNRQKREKTVLIERVENGWLIRPFEPCRDWVCTSGAPSRLWVFTDLREMLDCLPIILDGPPLPAVNNSIPNEPI